MRKGKFSLLARVICLIMVVMLLAMPFAGVPVLMAVVSAGVMMAMLVLTQKASVVCARDGPMSRNLHNERRDLSNGFDGGPHVAKSKRSNDSYQTRLPVYLSGASSGINSAAAGLSSVIRGVRHHTIGRARGSCRHLCQYRETATLSLGYG